jgi:hypothetical protein
MPNIIILQGCPMTRKDVCEYTVAMALNSITYPGIMQCITLTAYGPGPLLGAHISPGASQDQNRKVYKQLKDWGALHTKTWYVVGNIKVFFAPPGDDTRWKSYADIITDLVTHFGGEEIAPAALEVYTCDTSDIAAHYSQGAIDITVTHGDVGPTFSYINTYSGGMPKVPHQIHRHQLLRVVV